MNTAVGVSSHAFHLDTAEHIAQMYWPCMDSIQNLVQYHIQADASMHIHFF